MNKFSKILIGAMISASSVSFANIDTYSGEYSKAYASIVRQPIPRNVLPVVNNTPMNDIMSVAKKRLPDEFSGSDSVDQRIVDSYRERFKGLSSKARVLGDTLHNPSFSHPVVKLKAFVEENIKLQPSNSELPRFLKQINFYQEIDNLNAIELLILHQRIAASISEITLDEKNIFEHVVENGVFFSLLSKEARQNSVSAIFYGENHGNKGLDLIEDHYLTYIPDSASKKIELNMNAAMNEQVIYPCVNEGKFGIPFLVLSNLFDIYPIGMPSKKIRAHGIEMSPHGFFSHDLLHSIVDPRRRSLVSYTIKEIDLMVKNGGELRSLVKSFPTTAADRYQTLMTSLSNVSDFLFSRILIYRGVEDFRKSMAGFFIAMHEHPNFPSEVYGENDIDKVINTITCTTPAKSNLNDAKDDYTSWEVSYDPLETSPFDGSSKMSDQEISEWCLKNMTIEQAYNNQDFYDFNAGMINASNIVETKVKRSPRFIDVKFKMKDMSKVWFPFPTLYHKWENLDDNISLINYAGDSFRKPDLYKDESPRDLAMSTLNNVRNKINGLVVDFVTVAQFFTNYDAHNDGKTLAKKFFKNHRKWDKLSLQNKN